MSSGCRTLGLLQGKGPAALRQALDAAAGHGAYSGLDLIERAEELGVDVIVMDLVGAGYSFILAGRPVIVVDSEGAWFRQNFTIAHELGHLLAESDCLGEVRGVNDSERAANAFAAELLMPAATLRGTDWDAMNDGELAELVWQWGVSTIALRYRLENLEVPRSERIVDLLRLSTYELLADAWGNPRAVDLITERRARASRRRFPSELVEALRQAVASGRAPVESLRFVTGDEVTRPAAEASTVPAGDSPDPFDWI